MGYGYPGQMNGMVPGVGMGMGVEGMAGAEMAAAATGEESGSSKGAKDKVAKAKELSANKFKRVAGGKSWEDETLADWPESKSGGGEKEGDIEKGYREEGACVINICRLSWGWFLYLTPHQKM